MDKETFAKFFNIDDIVEVTLSNTTYIGKIVYLYQSELVVEELDGGPVIIALDKVCSCKKLTDKSPVGNAEGILNHEEQSDKRSLIINKTIATLDSWYKTYIIDTMMLITTNASIYKINATSVELITDDGVMVKCNKSYCVGYNRENAIEGRRVFCGVAKRRANMAFSMVIEMSYQELYEHFVRAINAVPKPRVGIIGAVLFYLQKTYGAATTRSKRIIKQLVKELNSYDIPVSFEVNQPSKKVKLEDITQEYKVQIYELLKNNLEEIQKLQQSDRIKYVDGLIFDNFNIRIKRPDVKVLVSEAMTMTILIPPTCEIQKYYQQNHNGSAYSSTEGKILFKDEVIIDESLKTDLQQFKFWIPSNQPIHVVCSHINIKGGRKVATFITTPCSLFEMKNKILLLKENGNYELANALNMYLINEGYLDSTMSAANILEVASEKLLELARKSKLIKDYDNAERAFKELISRGFSLDIVVRELATLYQSRKQANVAIHLLETYLPQLEDKIKTYNVLSPLYKSVGDTKKAIRSLENIISLLPKTEENIHKIDILQKRIKTLKKAGENVSSLDMDNTMSPLVNFDINNTTDDFILSLKEKTIEEKIKFISERIECSMNSPEVSLYYIAKIKLLNELTNIDREEMNNVFADYCKVKARYFLYENNYTSAREYLLEAITLCEREDLYSLLYLSMCASPQDVLLTYTSSSASYENITSSYIINDGFDKLYVLLNIIHNDNKLSRRLIRVLYESNALMWLSDELDCADCEPKEFIQLITAASKQSKEAIDAFEREVDEVLYKTNAIELSHSFLTIHSLSNNHVSQLDKSYIYQLREISNLALDCEKHQYYEECEETCRDAFEKIDVLTMEMQKKPTRLSITSFLPFIFKFKDLLERELDKRYNNMYPIITITPIGDALSIGNNVEMQITIKNDGGSIASDCKLEITSIDGHDLVNPIITEVETIVRGYHEISSTIIVRSSLIHTELVTVKYRFTYVDARKVSKQLSGTLSVSIDEKEDYEDFSNPYIAHVKSNAVTDKAMFKGRDEIINTICTYVLEDYKGFVIYGQKRSGKSSVLYHITQRLRLERKAFAVEYTMGNNIVQDAQSENESLANLFYTIISEIGRAIKEVDRNIYRECGCRIVRRKEFDTYPDETFKEYLDFYRDIIVEKLQYEQDKIVLIIDEFTYLYYHILEKKISPRIMEFWKGLIESRVFSFVFAGQDAMPRFMDEFQNVFASMHPQELTYIDEMYARELIEKPIWNKKNDTSRFHPDAVKEILTLTACSPFYIMIICSELVKFARERKRLPILANDVKTVVDKMICNESSLSRKDFDNLISCGESRLDIIDQDDSIKILKDIAINTRNVEYVDINNINSFDLEKVKIVTKDLIRRRVLELHPNSSNKIKIKVGLFKRWLLNHE